MKFPKELHKITEVPEEDRDHHWEMAFFESFVQGKIGVAHAEPQEGPDGWPYMLVETNPSANEPSLNMLGWLSERGIGLAVNTYKGVPDYVFTYGMIWNFRERAQFLSTQGDLPIGEIEFDKGQKIHAGPPSEKYLPGYVKEILRLFLKDQGIENPKILVLSNDQINYDLCFSLDSFGNPDKKDHADIAEALAWFLPNNYTIMLANEEGLPPFYDL